MAASTDRNSPRPVASSGIKGLDDILRGGYPDGSLILLEGDPGVGKTTLALQFLLDGARRGEPVVYVTLSETRAEIAGVAESHGWDLKGIEIFELKPPESLLATEENTLFHPSEVELAETTRAVVNLCNRIKPRRVVFDSLSEIRLLAQSSLRYRREVLALKQYFAGQQCTVLLLDDRTNSSDNALQSLAHGVLSLEQRSPLYGSQRRRLRVIKLRGVEFRGGYHDFNIARGGLQIYPRLVAAEHHQPFDRGEASSGIPALDKLVGGGLHRGTSTLFLGPAGTGKSALTSQWAVAAAERGERVALFAFDETLPTLLARSSSLGLKLQEHFQTGQIMLRQIDPAEVPPGQFVDEVREAVEKKQVSMVIVDSLNGYLNAMPDESFLTLQLHELLSYLGQRGVLTLLVAAQHGLVGPGVTSPADISYLADTVVLFRHFEIQGCLRKALSVLKKRTGRHEATIRELQLSSAGVSLGEPLAAFRGIFSGLASYEGGKVQFGDEQP